MNLKLKKGKYDVNVTYGGNENYTGSNATKKLTIKEEVVEATVESVSSYDSSSQTNGSKMPEETTKYMKQGKKPQMMEYPCQYTHSPELVEKYQARVKK